MTAEDTVPDSADQAPETVPASEPDQVQETVPAEDQGIGTPDSDGKIAISQDQYDMVERTEGDISKYKVLEDKPAEPVEDDPQTIVEEPVEGTPPEEPVETAEVTPEAAPVAEFEEAELGGQTSRKYPDGRVEVKLNVDGEEVWYDMSLLTKDLQFMQHNQAEAQRVAEDRKALEQERLEEQKMARLIDLTVPAQPPVQAQPESDDPFSFEAAPQVGQAPELGELRQQVASLTERLNVADATVTQQQVDSAAQANASFARGELSRWCQQAKWPEPSDAQLLADVQAEAARTKTDIAKIGSSPGYLIELTKRRFPKAAVPTTVDASETPKPPVSAPVKKSKPVSSSLDAAEKKLVYWKKQQAEGKGQYDEASINREIIEANRALDNLRGGENTI